MQQHYQLRYRYCLDENWEFPLTRNIFGQIRRLFWDTTTTAAKKIKIFVTNKIQFIIENADPKQWFYVPIKENPADDSSRGLKKCVFRENKKVV